MVATEKRIQAHRRFEHFFLEKHNGVVVVHIPSSCRAVSIEVGNSTWNGQEDRANAEL